MKEIEGNFWEVAPEFDMLLVTTNGITYWDPEERVNRLVMGGGIARQFRDNFPSIDVRAAPFVKQANEAHLFRADLCDDSPNNLKDDKLRWIITHPTKYHYKDPSDIKLIYEQAKRIKSMQNMLKRVTGNSIQALSVRPGCGLGLLSWSEVKPALIQAGWDDNFTIITPDTKTKEKENV